MLTGWLGLARILAHETPRTALSLNPLDDSSARRVLLSELGRLKKPQDAVRLLPLAQSLVSIAPIDARSHSLKAQILFLLQQPARAQASLETALKLAQTDLMGLSLDYQRAVVGADYQKAVARLDILYRRWPNNTKNLLPWTNAMVSDPAGYANLRTVLAQNPPWRATIVRQFMDDERTSDTGYRLAFDLAQANGRAGRPKRDKTVEYALRRLFQQERYDLAHNLFLFTLDEQEIGLNGYIFNPQFQRPPSGLPFFWDARDTNASTVSYRPASDGDGDATPSHLSIRFLDKPVRWAGLQKSMRLPSGAYRLTLRSRAVDLRAPKGLSGVVKCISQNRAILRFDIPLDNPQFADKSVDFSVPENCTYARFQVAATEAVSGFRFRYSGVLDIAAVTLERVGESP